VVVELGHVLVRFLLILLLEVFHVGQLLSHYLVILSHVLPHLESVFTEHGVNGALVIALDILHVIAM